METGYTSVGKNTDNNKHIICHFCGSDVIYGKFCSECGSKFVQTKEPNCLIGIPDTRSIVLRDTSGKLIGCSNSVCGRILFRKLSENIIQCSSCGKVHRYKLPENIAEEIK